MKKYILLFSISALVFTGCNPDVLDIPQKGVLPIENFYKTDADAEAALVGCILIHTETSPSRTTSIITDQFLDSLTFSPIIYTWLVLVLEIV
jgi:hypothetical protein